MDQPAVLIISDDAAFSNSIISRWHAERRAPAFTLMGGDVCQTLPSGTFQLAIVGEVGPGTLTSVLKALDEGGRPAVLVGASPNCRPNKLRVTVLRKDEGWLDTLVLLSTEILRRCEATALARRIEAANTVLEREATLGRYVLEMRHCLNNALTSILGNAELILLEPGLLNGGTRSQIETIRNMSLRMHEVLQRFSSLDNELSVAEKHRKIEEATNVRTAAAGR